MSSVRQVCIGCGLDVYNYDTVCPIKVCREVLADYTLPPVAPKALVEYVLSESLNFSKTNFREQCFFADLGKRSVKNFTVQRSDGTLSLLVLAIEEKCKGILFPVKWEKGFAFFIYTPPPMVSLINTGKIRDLVGKIQKKSDEIRVAQADLGVVQADFDIARKIQVKWSTLSRDEQARWRLKWKRDDKRQGSS